MPFFILFMSFGGRSVLVHDQIEYIDAINHKTNATMIIPFTVNRITHVALLPTLSVAVYRIVWLPLPNADPDGSPDLEILYKDVEINNVKTKQVNHNFVLKHIIIRAHDLCIFKIFHLM